MSFRWWRRFLVLPALMILGLALPDAGGRAQAPGDGGQPPPAEAPAEGATEREVAAEVDPGQDRAIRDRLRATFQGVEALRGIDVEVSAGVVRLTGEVPSDAARSLAGQLARQVEDVALVENQLRQVQDLDRRLQITFERLRERALALLVFLPLLLLAALVVLAFWLAGRWLARRRWPFRAIDNGFLRQTARQLAWIGVLLLGALLALEILDATGLVAAVLGTAGLFGLVLGLAFRDLAENAIASLLLSLRQPFAPNDLVRIEDHEGHVVRLTSRATVLLSVEGNHVRIPNATVYKGILINYTRNPLRRFDLVAGVGVDDDLNAARGLGIEALAGTPGVLADPAPEAFVEALGESNVRVRYLGWVDQRANDYLKVRSEAIRRVKEALDQAGVSLPEPTYTVRLREEGKRPAGRDLAASPRPSGEKPPLDVGREDVIERQAAAERAAAGPDLLDPGAPREL